MEPLGFEPAQTAFENGRDDVLHGISGGLIVFDLAVWGQLIDDHGQELRQQGEELGALQSKFGSEALNDIAADGGFDFFRGDGLVFARANPGGRDVTEAGGLEFADQTGETADLIEQTGDGA